MFLFILVSVSILSKIIDTFIQHSSVVTTGGIIVLELETKNYSLTEISKIVESNNAMILQSAMATSINQNFIQVSLKINKNDRNNYYRRYTKKSS